MIPSVVQALTSPAGVLAIAAGHLSFALGRSPAWPLLAAGRPAGAAVITVSIATAVYTGVTAVVPVLNT
jgi:hypothetical protein